jgi:hypothetical protein
MYPVRGRLLAETDDAASAPIMVVNEAFVTTFLPQQDPIGRRIFSGFDTTVRREEVEREIVGVVNDTRDRGMNRAPGPTIYVPSRERPGNQLSFSWCRRGSARRIDPTQNGFKSSPGHHRSSRQLRTPTTAAAHKAQSPKE